MCPNNVWLIFNHLDVNRRALEWTGRPEVRVQCPLLLVVAEKTAGGIKNPGLKSRTTPKSRGSGGSQLMKLTGKDVNETLFTDSFTTRSTRRPCRASTEMSK